MKASIKKRWIKALLSGKYKQGPGFLNRNGEFCCLGVLEDIRIKGKWKEVKDGTGHFYTVPEALHSSSLSKPCLEWAGLPASDSLVDIRHANTHSTLAHLNDTGSTFKEIAKIIEDQL